MLTCSAMCPTPTAVDSRWRTVITLPYRPNHQMYKQKTNLCLYKQTKILHNVPLTTSSEPASGTVLKIMESISKYPIACLTNTVLYFCSFFGCNLSPVSGLSLCVFRIYCTCDFLFGTAENTIRLARFSLLALFLSWPWTWASAIAPGFCLVRLSCIWLLFFFFIVAFFHSCALSSLTPRQDHRPQVH